LQSDLDFPTGKVKQPTDQYLVRVKGKFQSVDEIKTLPIITLPSGSTVYLGDIARVEDSYNEDHQPTRLTLKDAVGVNVIKTSDANSTQTADNVYKIIHKLEDEYKQYGIKFDIAQDVTTFTRASIDEVLSALLIAIFLVSCVLFLFLRSGRNALIVLVSIPVSLISTLFFMWIFGFTINMMSMMALSLVIGVLVDDSIVVLENIHRKLDEVKHRLMLRSKGRNEIGFAAVAITLVDVVVFLPISLVSGLAGKIFREFGLTVVVSTLISLFVSFTLTPMLAAKFGKGKPLHWWKIFQTVANFLSPHFRWLRTFSGLAGIEIQKYSRLVIAAPVGDRFYLGSAFLGSCSLVITGKIGGEFITTPDRGEFAANFDFPDGTNTGNC